MTEILFDNIIYSLQQSGGISSMWAMLQKGLLSDAEFQCSFIEQSQATKNIFRKKLNLPINHTHISKTLLPLIINRYCNAKLPQEETPHIFHSSYYRVPSRDNVKTAVTVHDFTYEKFMSGWKRNIHCRQKYHAIRKADAIVCVSQNTRSDLLHYLPDVNPDKIQVIYNGISEDFHTINGVERGDRLLYVGDRAGYKNFELLIEVLSSTSHLLDICGAPLTQKEKHFIDNKLGESRYNVYSHINNHQLNRLYNTAKCLVYPSAYEGFGLPIVEAQKTGCPVIALNASSIPEIIGETPLLMPRADRKSLISALYRLESRSTISEVIAAGGKNAIRFTSQSMINAYKSLYKSL